MDGLAAPGDARRRQALLVLLLYVAASYLLGNPFAPAAFLWVYVVYLDRAEASVGRERWERMRSVAECGADSVQYPVVNMINAYLRAVWMRCARTLVGNERTRAELASSVPFANACTAVHINTADAPWTSNYERAEASGDRVSIRFMFNYHGKMEFVFDTTIVGGKTMKLTITKIEAKMMSVQYIRNTHTYAKLVMTEPPHVEARIDFPLTTSLASTGTGLLPVRKQVHEACRSAVWNMMRPECGGSMFMFSHFGSPDDADGDRSVAAQAPVSIFESGSGAAAAAASVASAADDAFARMAGGGGGGGTEMFMVSDHTADSGASVGEMSVVDLTENPQSEAAAAASASALERAARAVGLSRVNQRARDTEGYTFSELGMIVNGKLDGAGPSASSLPPHLRSVDPVFMFVDDPSTEVLTRLKADNITKWVEMQFCRLTYNQLVVDHPGGPAFSSPNERINSKQRALHVKEITARCPSFRKFYKDITDRDPKKTAQIVPIFWRTYFGYMEQIFLKPVATFASDHIGSSSSSRKRN